MNVPVSGRYRLELRRYPVEPDLPIGADRLRLKLDGFEVECALATTDTSAEFVAELPKGPARLQSWVHDASMDRTIGAYYIYVRRDA